MKENTRRIVLFAAIVVFGSIMIFFDVPLIVLIPLVLIVGFSILFAIGAITIGDIRSSLARVRKSDAGKKKAPAQPSAPAAAQKPAPASQKTGIFNRLKGFHLPFKKPAATAAPAPKVEKKPDKKDAAKTGEKIGGIGRHLGSFFTSLKSFGTAIQVKSKAPRKIGDINKQLDETVGEKIPAEKSLPVSVPTPAGGATAAAAGPQASSDQADPFLSLSDDEFDAGLLDGLDDQDTAPLEAPAAASVSPETAAEPALSAPSLELDAASAEILKSQDQGGLDEFSGLETDSGGMDAEFGDLDNISLDDVDMDVDLEGDLEDGAGSPAPDSPSDQPPVAAPAAVPAAADPGVVKTAWIPSDAPKEQVEDQISTQSDMAAFAGGATTSDEDMLSSLASDVKTVKKEKNISLLRELKDFKAPATDIEKELDDMYKKMESVKSTQAKKTDSTTQKGIK